MIRITHFIMDDLRLSNFQIYHTFDAILRHISLSIEICRSSWSHMILITREMHVELTVYCYLIMNPQWSLFWAIQLGSYFSTFRYHHTSSYWIRFFDVWIWFSCWHGWLGLHTWWWMILCHLIFWPTKQTSDAILGHISVLVEICRSPLIFMIIPIYEIHVKLIICFYFTMIP